MLGGMFNASPQMPAPPGWLHYVSRGRREPRDRSREVRRRASAERADGGSGGDWIAPCIDPQGAMFAVHARKK